MMGGQVEEDEGGGEDEDEQTIVLLPGLKWHFLFLFTLGGNLPHVRGIVRAFPFLISISKWFLQDMKV